jgi:transcriptional regulator with XRE-family HTH domain
MAYRCEPWLVLLIMKTFEKLRERRSQLGLTQWQVAMSAKMSTVQYNGYENERHVPSEATLERLAKALKTSALDLRDDDAPADLSAAELKEAFRRKLAEELRVSPNSIEIFVKWN